MAPKVKKCSTCGTNASPRWITLDRWLLCDACYDVQCNPPLEPVSDRDEEEAGPSGLCGLGRGIEMAAETATTIIATASAAPPSNAADDAIFTKPTFIPRPSKPTPKRTVLELPPKERASLRGVKRPMTPRPKPRKIVPKLPTHDEETIRARSVEKLFHDSFWYEVGDIVSLIDTKDNTYYAQIRGLIMNAFNEKSAVLTWLIPTVESPPPNEGFDPATYQIGPDEDEPRPLDHVSFVMHAPSGYYFDRHSAYPRPNTLGPIRNRQPTATVTSANEPKYDWANISHLHYGEHTARRPPQ
uniref:GATA zinc finger domain-containing protein 1 n=1 Tax=Anopheles farauti TaxID=69004 RepID=A0A182QZ35_9DIPT